MKLLPGVASITRGLIEPALYRATSAAGATCGLVTHHIDDGRAIAPTAQALEDLLKHLARYFVLKRSTIQWEGDAHSYLKRLKVRRAKGWTTLPDARHRANVCQAAGVDLNNPGRRAGTPGAKRAAEPMDEVFLKTSGGKREVKDYQSGVGSLIYYSADCELVAYAWRR